MEIKNNTLELSVGTVNQEELIELAAGGAEDPRIWTPLTSSMNCISAITAVGDFLTNFFSCGDFC